VKTVSGALAVLVLGIAAGCGSSGGTTGGGGTSTSSAKRELKVQLQEQNFSGEAGTATLTPDGDKTRVDVLMASYAANAQPMHIHKGTCLSLDPTPAYPLHDLVVGKSVTVVPISLDDLLNGKYAINVHRSAKKLKVYVACGDINENAAPAPTFTQGEDDD
jgi:hypothetical protein